MKSNLEALAEVVRAIPHGRVRGYGEIGQEMPNPVSGLLIGRWMGQIFDDVPWWRVIGADGSIKTFKRGPEHGMRQRQLLEQEGIEFCDGMVPKRFFM
ncbi:MAG: MGMT family protein [Chthonomonas sp.]|nr:MGMT family protein [Chthonomonas sp.]